MRNTFQWNVIWNSNVFIQENVVENFVCEMAAILSRPQCVKGRLPLWNSLVAYILKSGAKQNDKFSKGQLTNEVIGIDAVELFQNKELNINQAMHHAILSWFIIPWICYERSFSEFYLFIWNQLVFNQRLQLFVQSPQPSLLIFAGRN